MPAWVPCPSCDGFWCSRHQEHTDTCPCPPIERWESDPYSDDAPQPVNVPRPGRILGH